MQAADAGCRVFESNNTRAVVKQLASGGGRRYEAIRRFFMNYITATLGVEASPVACVEALVERDVVVAGDHNFVGVGARSKPLHKTTDFSRFAGVSHVAAMNENIPGRQRLQNM